MRVLFIAPGVKQNWASSRYRCQWIAEHLDEAVLVDAEEIMRGEYFPTNFDVYVFEKIGSPSIQKELLKLGKQVWWDVCDPTWWWSPGDVNGIIENVTGMVASCPSLAEDLSEWSGKQAHCITDRLNMQHYNHRKEHSEVEPVRLIWYGSAQNRIALFAALANLERAANDGYKIALTIYDNMPEKSFEYLNLPIYYSKWNIDTEVNVISAHDIALLPPYPGPWGKVKSNNKALTAWACGLPVTDAQYYKQLTYLLDSHIARQEDANDGYKVLVDRYTIEKSVEEWKELWTSQR